jgi:hypothetical protein
MTRWVTKVVRWGRMVLVREKKIKRVGEGEGTKKGLSRREELEKVKAVALKTEGEREKK